MDSGLFSDSSEGTGSDHLVGITQLVQSGDSVRAKLGYSLDRAFRREEYRDYTGNKGFMALTRDLPFNITASIYGEYYMKDYKGNPATKLLAEPREDRVQTYSLSLKKELSARLSITGSQMYILNRSNVQEYDYRRAVSSIIFSMWF